MGDTPESRGGAVLTGEPEDAEAAQPVWRSRKPLRSLGRAVITGAALLGVALVGFVGASWVTSLNRHPAAQPVQVLPSQLGTTPSAGPRNGVEIPKNILEDSAQLTGVLVAAHIPYRIQTVRLHVVGHTVLIGCAGDHQDGLPQLYEVMGQPPLLHELRSGGTGISIDASRLPPKSYVSFIYWLGPKGSTLPADPVISLEPDGTPPCTGQTRIPRDPSQ